MIPALREMTREILQHPFDREWSTQGLGMIRTYFGGKRFRLNVWNKSLKIPNVSPIHDHPWSFESFVVSGYLFNRRYAEQATCFGCDYYKLKIQCGEGGRPLSSQSVLVSLRFGPIEVYTPGQSYIQKAEEIHESMPENGCVTINDRTEGTGLASVYWYKSGGPNGFVTAEPRKATQQEIHTATQCALAGWQNDA